MRRPACRQSKAEGGAPITESLALNFRFHRKPSRRRRNTVVVGGTQAFAERERLTAWRED
jgi:hypothetical protein